MKKLFRSLRRFTGRTVAFIILKVSVTGGGASLLGADRTLALSLAAFQGVLEVSEEMSRAYLDDGKIDDEELNDGFKTLADKQKRK